MWRGTDKNLEINGKRFPTFHWLISVYNIKICSCTVETLETLAQRGCWNSKYYNYCCTLEMRSKTKQVLDLTFTLLFSCESLCTDDKRQSHVQTLPSQEAGYHLAWSFLFLLGTWELPSVSDSGIIIMPCKALITSHSICHPCILVLILWTNTSSVQNL